MLIDDLQNQRMLLSANVLQLQALDVAPFAAWGLGSWWRGRDLGLDTGNDAYWLPLDGEPFRVAPSRNALDRDIRGALSANGGIDVWLKPNVWSWLAAGNQVGDASGLTVDDLSAFLDDLESQLNNARTLADVAGIAPTENQQQVISELTGAAAAHRPLISDPELLAQRVSATRFLTVAALLLDGHGVGNGTEIAAAALVNAEGESMPTDDIDRVTQESGSYRPAVKPPGRSMLGKLVVPAAAGLAGFYLGGPLGAVLGAVGGSLAEVVLGPRETRPAEWRGGADPTGPHTRDGGGDDWGSFGGW